MLQTSLEYQETVDMLVHCSTDNQAFSAALLNVVKNLLRKGSLKPLFGLLHRILAVADVLQEWRLKSVLMGERTAPTKCLRAAGSHALICAQRLSATSSSSSPRATRSAPIRSSSSWSSCSAHLRRLADSQPCQVTILRTQALAIVKTHKQQWLPIVDLLEDQLYRAPSWNYQYSNDTIESRTLHRTISAQETLRNLRDAVVVRRPDRHSHCVIRTLQEVLPPAPAAITDAAPGVDTDTAPSA